MTLAVDRYGDGKQAQHPDDTGKFAAEVSQNKAMAKARFEAAIKVLRARENVDGTRLAAVGYPEKSICPRQTRKSRTSS